jgi:outer membrane protein OmpA-like peptidoglycan-associated protein
MTGKKFHALHRKFNLFKINLLIMGLLLVVVLQGDNAFAAPENFYLFADSNSGNGNAMDPLGVESRDSKSFSSSPYSTGLSLNFQVDFGKATYGDSDGNGFDDATILGGGVSAVMDLWGPWSLWADFDNATSYDALTVYPGYDILDPSVKSDEKGTLTNRIMDGGITYGFNGGKVLDRFQLGLGWLNYDFIAKEHGYLETRDYSGIEVLFHGEKGLNDRVIIQGSLELAPALSVADHVKGDYANPDRTASTSYGAYFWSTKCGLRIMLNPRVWLESGFTYQMLHGDGHENPDYRFLEHDYTRYGFYALFGTRFFGSRVSTPNEPVKPIPTPVPPTEAKTQSQLEPAVQHPAALVVINRITPDSGIINHQVDLTIEGTGFHPGAQVLFRTGQATISVTNRTFISENQLTCTLDLKGAVLGSYDLKVTNPDGQFGEMPKAFVVKGQELPVIPEPVPIVTSSGEGFNNGSILLTLKGTGFVPGTTVKMVSSTGAVVSGEIEKLQSDKITGFFNLKGQSEGTYDIIATYPDGHSAKLSEGFKVKTFSEEKSRTLMPVHFDVGKATIGADQVGSIKGIIGELQKNPKARIMLGGYTDMRGSVSYNLNLSMRRVEAVKEILIAGGVNPERIDIYAYGKEKAKAGTDENIWRNDRRVDIAIYQEN